MNKRLKTSSVWSYFTVVDNEEKLSKCDLCCEIKSFKSSVSNLRKHMSHKHPTVKLLPPTIIRSSISTSNDDFLTTDDDTMQILPATSKPDDGPNLPGTASFSRKPEDQQPSSLSSFPQPRKMSETQKRKIDKTLIKLFTLDFQPYSIVEDRGFNQFIKTLNSNYDLPDRKSISKGMIPAEYERCMITVKQQLNSVQSVCLTTDTWTSRNAESYLAVTAHFINDYFELRTVLLQCSVLPISHTGVNLANEIKKITETFNLTHKVLVVVTDNDNNIKNAITSVLGWNHFDCFAHTLNLIVQDALKIIKSLQDKIKTIIRFFKKSSVGMEKLLTTQNSMGLIPMKLIQDVPTRWNSTYYMVERISKLQDAVKSTIAVLNADVPILSLDEWTICREMSIVLKPFEEITKNISGERYITGSQVPVFVKGLMSVLKKMEKETFHPLVLRVVNELHKGLSQRMANIEYNKTIALATILDPRFKLFAFTDERAAQEAKKYCIDLVAKEITETHVVKEESPGNQEPPEPHVVKEEGRGNQEPPEPEQSHDFSIWTEFDEVMSSQRPTSSKMSAAMAEVTRYLEDVYLKRDQDPILWWSQNQFLYPNITKLVKKKFNVLATSVPCERIFSKAGSLFTEKRSRLNGKHLEELLFLNANDDFENKFL